MVYGVVDLKSADIAFLLSRLDGAAIDVKTARENSNSDDERTFYEQALLLVDRWRSTVGRLKAGRRGFAEQELLYLRGTIAERNAGSLAARCVAAKLSGDPSLAQLEAEYDQWCSLQAKLEQPFVRDRSHDAEADEDEEDEEGA
ncbi:hypothetical protein HFO56_23995 [Rhizobium laguerreae]|uniref:hypothetical protein n=1 Tax=Rhizobium laguerreae TaxID=1076926 RepID=UPI001C911890|nr:hypothetical protein [Rhizobium laguerreae]MBY3155391.1 hypothetical protein [Rhizobium laguerreae]